MQERQKPVGVVPHAELPDTSPLRVEAQLEQPTGVDAKQHKPPTQTPDVHWALMEHEPPLATRSSLATLRLRSCSSDGSGASTASGCGAMLHPAGRSEPGLGSLGAGVTAVFSLVWIVASGRVSPWVTFIAGDLASLALARATQ